MRRVLILLSAVFLGLAAGYGWSALTAPAAEAKAPRKARTMALPAPPEELPAALDRDSAARGDDSDPLLDKQGSPDPTQDSAAVEQSVYYAGCNEPRAAGRAPIYAGQPGYRQGLDGDGDGIACEPHPER
jgi:hypothetical protein